MYERIKLNQNDLKIRHYISQRARLTKCANVQRIQHITWKLHFNKFTLMRTSPALGGPTVTVSIESGFFASQATAALHSMDCSNSYTTISTHKVIFCY